MSSSKLKFDPHRQRVVRARMVRIRPYILQLLLIGIGLYLAYNFLGEIVNLEEKPMIKWLLPLMSSAAVIGYLALKYLEGNNPRSYTSNSRSEITAIREEMRYLMSELQLGQASAAKENVELFNSLKVQIEKNNDFKWNSSQQEELFESIKRAFATNVDAGFFKSLNLDIATELTKEKKSQLDIIGRESQSIKSRLVNEVETLNRKANLNLVIGSMATIIALIGLAYVVFQHNGIFVSTADMAYHYLPRISLVIFIEVFAYFFLRLYKLNLDDTKYFQNELTNIELQLLATLAAISFGKDIDVTSVITQLSRTERNFILKKGETTIELEKSKMDRNELKAMVSNLTRVISRTKHSRAKDDNG